MFFLISTVNPANAALTATTANTIEGTKPRFVIAIENDINAGNDFSYFGLEKGGVSYFTQNDIDTNVFSGLNLSLSTETPANFITRFNVALGTPMSADATDTDGDVFDELGDSGVALKWYDSVTDTELDLTQKSKSFCLLTAANIQPELRIEGPIELRTTYGAPRAQAYPDSSVSVTNNPRKVLDYGAAFGLLSATITNAKPDMTHATGVYAGPATMWDTSKGFKVISTTNYNQNFPTTGFNGAYFDLLISGVDARCLTWEDVPVGNVKATVQVTSATTVRVTLTGPAATAAQQNATNPSSVSPVIPAFTGSSSAFLIEGKQGSSTIVSYGFQLQKWFITTGAKKNTPPNHNSWCSNINGSSYSLPKIAYLTSAQGTTVNISGTIPTVPYPNPNGNYFWRHIGGRLFSEWDNLSSYSGAGFLYPCSWASDSTGNSSNWFFVHPGIANTGVGIWPNTDSYSPTVCVSN